MEPNQKKWQKKWPNQKKIHESSGSQTYVIMQEALLILLIY